MPRGPLKFKDRDVQRAYRAARKAGMVVDRLKIDPDGSITLFATPSELEPLIDENEWDEIINGKPAA
jgi:hypothetical protein